MDPKIFVQGSETNRAKSPVQQVITGVVDVGSVIVNQKISQKVGTSVNVKNITFAKATDLAATKIEQKIMKNNSVAGRILSAAINRAGGLKNLVTGKSGYEGSIIPGFPSPINFDFYILPEWGGTPTGEKIEFVFTPESFSDLVSANFASETIMGRVGPIYGYSNTSGRDINFSVVLHDDYPKGQLLQTVRMLQSLVYPKYTGNYTQTPSCQLKIGDIVNGRYLLMNTTVTWRKPMRVSSGGAIYVMAEVGLSFRQVVSVPPSAEEVAQGKYDGVGNATSAFSFKAGKSALLQKASQDLFKQTQGSVTDIIRNPQNYGIGKRISF